MLRAAYWRSKGKYKAKKQCKNYISALSKIILLIVLSFSIRLHFKILQETAGGCVY